MMLSLTEIVKYFHRGSVNEVLALNGASLEVKRGDFVSIIGSNGAGKSTLLNCVAGCFAPDSGSIVVKGTDVTSWPEYKRAAYLSRVFQDPLRGTCASGTIEQNLAMASRRGKRNTLAMGVKKREREEFREQLATLKLGLEDRLKDRAGLLSGGQRQALTMLMATMVRPDILLLDEHTAALDPKTSAQILELTDQIIHEQHLTAMMVTHNMQHALELGNRLVMMHQGQIILDVEGDEKKKLQVQDLMERFYAVRGETYSDDRALLV